MKFRQHIIAALIFAWASCQMLASPAAYCQSAGPVDPPAALAIASRLQEQGSAAETYGAAARAAGNIDVANFEKEIAHRRYVQAAAKLGEIDNSATYGKSHWAPEALIQKSIIEDQKLHNPNAVVETLKVLFNKHGQEDFVGKQQAKSLQQSAEIALDYSNKTKYPGRILYQIIDFFVAITGRQYYSYAIAIVLISVVVKLLLTPLSNMQYRSMREMQRLTPVLAEIKAKYKNPQDQQVRMQEVYKEHGVNPLAGCLPLLIQMPILITLYQAIRIYGYQFSHGTFLWISPTLGAQFPTIVGQNLGLPDTPILLLYGLSMYLQQKMTPPTDPTQAEQQKMMAIMMPIMSTFMFLQWKLPSAFVLYYLVFNVLSMAQQKYYMKVRAKDAPLQPITLSGSSSSSKSPTKSTYQTNGAAATKRTPPTAQSSAKGVISPSNGTPSKKKRRQQ